MDDLRRLHAQGDLLGILRATATDRGPASGTPAALLPFRVRAFLDLGRSEEAGLAVREALASWPDDPDVLVVGATFQNAGNNPLAAEKLYQKALLVVPDHPAALRGLAFTWLRAGILEPALELAARGLRARASDTALLFCRSLAAFRLGHLEAARESASTYLAAGGGDSPEIRYLLAHCLALASHTDGLRRAEEEFRRGLSLQATHVPSLNDLACLLSGAGQASRALDLIDPLLSASGRSGFALDTAAEVYLKLGRRAEAETCLREAVGKEPRHPGIGLRLARLYRTIGRTDLASQTLTAVLAVCDGDPGLQRRVREEFAQP